MSFLNERQKEILLNKSEQIAKYKKHKKKFKIKNNTYLELFESLLNKSDNYFLECSCKLEGDNIFPSRFNIIYCDERQTKNINLILDFLKKLSVNGAKINYRLLKKIFDRKIRTDKIKRVAVGIDLRKNMASSRVKFWMEPDKEYFYLFKKVLILNGYNRKVGEVMNKKVLPFGFDFSFGGKTRIKVYPYLDRYEIGNKDVLRHLQSIFSKHIFKLITNSRWVCISFKDKNNKRILHLKPKDLACFLKTLRNKKLDNLVRFVGATPVGCIISILETEADQNDLREINFYY
jgi:LynF/TruF/PatF family peptide O-prenyltransferase